MAEQSSINQMSKLSLSEKDIFNKKGGTFALFVLIVVGLLAVLNMKAIYEFAQNLLGAIITFGVIGLIIFLCYNKHSRMVVSMGYMFLMQKLVSIFIKIDPILILKDTLRDMREKISIMDDSINKLNGVRKSIEAKIKSKREDFEKFMNLAQAADKKGDRDLATVHKRQALRIEKLIGNYINLFDNSEKWYNTMEKMAKIAKLVLMDTENEVEAKEEEYNMIKLSHKAFRSAMSVIQGDPDRLALYNQAFQFVNDDIMAKIGEMDRFLSSSDGLLKQIDLENDVIDIQGDELIAKYNEMGIDAMFAKFEKAPLGALDIDGTGSKQKPTGTPFMSSNVEPSRSRGKYF